MNKILKIAVLTVCLSTFGISCYGAEQNIEKPTVKAISAEKQVQKTETPVITVQNTDYSTVDLKKLSDEINSELMDEHEKTLEDLRVLWQAAIERSETVKFAIYKLSNPEGEKVDQSMVKKILSPIASVAPLVGIGTGIPIAEGSSMIGGGVLNSFLADESAINSHLSRVTDADLIILAKEIDNLQQKLLNLYYNYITSMKILNFSDVIVKHRYENYEKAQNSKPDRLELADAFYREALDQQYKARQDLLSSRTALEQLVGNDALIEIDKSIKGRILSSL